MSATSVTILTHTEELSYSGEKVKDQEDTFNEVISPTFNFLSFRFQKSLLKQIRTNNYDSVILLFNFYYISNFISLIRFKQVNFILWGPWINGSKIRDYLRLKLMKYNHSTTFLFTVWDHSSQSRGNGF